MQEKTTFKLSEKALKSLDTPFADKQPIIQKELLARQHQIEDLLISYHFKSRGRVFNVRIEQAVFKDALQGFFKVRYSVGHFNACADIDTSEEENMTVQFEINPLHGALILLGEFVPERDPDEF